MKIHIISLIFVGIALTAACLSPKSSAPPAKPAEMVLEVVTTAYGSAYPREGDILQMRLFEDGRFEYDDFPDYNPPQATSRNVSVKRKEAKLEPEDLAELINLAEQPDFLSAQETYPVLRNQLDTGWNTTIKFKHNGREKKIFAPNFWVSYDQEEGRGKYPPSMVKLLERVEELKAKAIGRTSKQWLTQYVGKNHSGYQF